MVNELEIRNADPKQDIHPMHTFYGKNRALRVSPQNELGLSPREDVPSQSKGALKPAISRRGSYDQGN